MANFKYMCSYCNHLYEFNVNGRCKVCGNDLYKIKENMKYSELSRIILKVSNENVINSMRNGEFWFQSPTYYQNYKGDGNVAIADITECAYKYIHKINKNKAEAIAPLKLGEKIKVDGAEYTIKDITGGAAYEPYEEINSHRLLCFYQLSFDEKLDIIAPDNKLKQFGDYFSLINTNELEHLLKNELSQFGIDLLSQTIKYINMDFYEGVYNPFSKDLNRFGYQKEFRIVLTSNNFYQYEREEPFKIHVENFDLSKIISIPYPIDILYKSKNTSEFKKLIEDFKNSKESESNGY